ncbi:MAG: VOC family protein [Candidatus Nitrosocosmicus sp.]|nr:VOC family protein [Candidatus Nitrosocosmicus sp.]MDN5868062.1 VOC family protein [Candidatus Nitrosocosmicus sp.]
MPIIQHFEFPADDVERAKKFYRGIWMGNGEVGYPEDPSKDYWFGETKDENGKKGLSGGTMKRQSQEHKVTNYITVNSIEEYTQKIEQAGGKIIVPKTEIPNMGYYEIFLDSEGNMFGLYQANQ